MTVADRPLAGEDLTRRLAEQVLGAPVQTEVLKYKEGRRRTTRARGPRGNAIVKAYCSPRAPTVARRVRLLAAGPPEPLVPEVLLLAAPWRVLVLSEVPGAPLREALLSGDVESCARGGAVLAGWHLAFRGAESQALRRHTIERELAILERKAEEADARIGRAVGAMASELDGPWECPTVVHRDLYEEQIVLGDRVGLIDLDDAALGPPELDLGNLCAHVELLGLRSGRSLEHELTAFLEGYRGAAVEVDEPLVERCRALSALRLACIHGEDALLERAAA